MQAPNPPLNIVRFGIYQLDLTARELHKAGVKVKLQDQPLRVLALLVERADQVVTREEFRQKVWPTDVYVGFDQGLNNAIKKVRDALGDSADSPRFIETVDRHGYRFISPISPVPKQLSEPEVQSGLRSPRNVVLIGLASVCFIATSLFWAWHRSGKPANRSDEKAILAVLPFDNLSRDPDQEFFSEGLTEEMIAQLGKLNPERLIVIARGSVAKYKGSRLAVDQIGQALHADYLVQGSVRRASDRVRITVQLIQVRDQTDLWAESYDREMKDMLVLEDSVTRTIAKQIHITLTAAGQTRLSSPPQLNAGAYEAYLKGRYYWNKRTADGLQKAEAYFQQAITEDPAYGAAYSGLADCNSGLAWHGFKSPAEALAKAYAAALKATEIDPLSAEAHASLGLVLNHRWEWANAEAQFKRSLQLDPRYANAHHWYADNLSARGRHGEALLEAKQALELDPLNLMIGTWVGLRYYLARQYDLSLEQVQNTVDLDPNFAAAHLLLGETYIQMGMHQKSLAELQIAAGLSGNSPLYLAQVAVAQASSGNKTEALRIIAQLQAIANDQYVSPYGVAQIYAALNDKEQAFRWLRIAYDEHAVWVSYLAVDPVFDGLRSDQRFQNLLGRVGLLPQFGG